MKIKSIVVVLGFMLALAGCASTNAGKTLQERTVVIDGKNIEVTDVSRQTWSDDKSLNNSDFGNGVYITVNSLTGGTYKNLEEIVKNYLTTRGIKTSDKIEGSDMCIKFSILGSPNIEDAENKAGYSNRPNSDQVTAVSAGVLLGGPTAALGYAFGAMLNIDKEAIVGSEIMRKPILGKDLFGRDIIKSSDEGGKFHNLIKIKYRLEKDKEAGDDIVFKMIVSQWGKKYILPENN